MLVTEKGGVSDKKTTLLGGRGLDGKILREGFVRDSLIKRGKCVDPFGTYCRFIKSRNQQQTRDVQANASVRIILPFKLSDLGKKITSDLRPVFTSKKIADDIRKAEAEAQCVPLRIQM